MESYLLFKIKKETKKKKLEREKDMIHEKIQKKQKMLKKTLLFSAATRIAFLAEKTLKFDFLYFRKSCKELNFLLKNTNTK